MENYILAAINADLNRQIDNHTPAPPASTTTTEKPAEGPSSNASK